MAERPGYGRQHRSQDQERCQVLKQAQRGSTHFNQPGTSNNPSCQLPPDYTYDNVAGYAYKFAGSNHNEAWAVCIKETGMMHGYEQGPDFALTPTISAILGFDNDSGLDQTNYFCALDCP